ncbi:MAG: Tat pathway signal sequence domain protein, partial [Pseudomonadota bacterium]
MPDGDTATTAGAASGATPSADNVPAANAPTGDVTEEAAQGAAQGAAQEAAQAAIDVSDLGEADSDRYAQLRRQIELEELD